MVRRTGSVAAALLVIALSGCLDGSFGFGPDEVGPEVGWPSESDATLRPGTRLYVSLDDRTSLQCTAGFLFASADNATLYLSFSAHCLGSGADRKGLGANVYADRNGRMVHVGDVAFDGWADGEDLRRDFALVAIRNLAGIRDRTHPSVEYWGGPTGVADTSTLVPGSEVITYGASSLREPNDPDNVKSGRFVTRDNLPVGLAEGDQLVVRLDPPSMQGDSGAPLMLANGRAAGILSQGGSFAIPGADFSFFVPVDEMLDEVHREPSLRGVRLVGWTLS